MLKAKIRPQGGIHPDSHKQLSSEQSIRTMETPKRLILPLRQHAGAAALAVVSMGDRVEAYQMVARPNGRFSMPIHTPLSGEVTGVTEQGIIIKVDAVQKGSAAPLNRDLSMLDRNAMIELVAQAGIVGMGGAMFPTADKLKLSLQQPIKTLIINGSECEPYLTCDDRLMREQGQLILGGLRYMMQMTGATEAFIGIEANKPVAMEQMDSLCADEPGIEVVELPALYPMGSEKQLIEAVTGLQVPSGKLSADVGVLVQNVATCIAVFSALRFGRPLTHRVITISGEAVEQPGNILAPIGMPVSEIIAQCGGLKSTAARIVLGGPMMGRAISDIHTPVTKGTSGILLLTEAEIPAPKASACVRCGRCVGACPMGLTPVEMVNELKRDQFDNASAMGLGDCLLCGSCAYVCPAAIPMTEYFDWGKQTLNRKRLEAQKSKRTCTNSAARRERMEREAAEKEAAKAAKAAASPRRSARRTPTQEAS